HTDCPLTDFGGKTSIFSHPVYLFLRKFSLQDSRGGSLCGVSPVPVSSGKTNRYRLNRGGDRAANSALHIIAIGRLRTDAKTKEYVARRVAEGHTKMEAIRCLKRYISREVYTLLRNQNRRINSIPITA
ncbi:transposase, partial [Escherichia coli]|uniref:transposase n=1 Tax=Escherichia coli TaxID=562 RepID=UPI001E2F1674